MIRKLCENDKYKFIEMCRDFYSMDCVAHEIPVENILRTFDLIVSGSEYADAFVYEKDNEITGYILLAITYSNESGGIVIWLDEIYVCPEYRGNGIGSKLIDFVLEKYKTASRFRLEVTECNKSARKLYASKGFKDLSYEQMEILKN